MDKLGKIHRHHWKECLNISKIVNFESDAFYASKDIARQRCENLQTFVWWGASLCPPPYKRLQNFMTLRSYIFVSFQQITFKLGNFINLKVFFLVVSMDSLQLVHVKSWKKAMKRSIYGLTSSNFGCMRKRNGRYCLCKYLLKFSWRRKFLNILRNDFGQHCAFVIFWSTLFPRSGDQKWGLTLKIAPRLSLMPLYFPDMGLRGFPLTSTLGLSTELKMVSFQMNGIWHK